MSTNAQPADRKMPRDLRGAPIEAVRRLALDNRQDQSAKDANEWYWVLRFNHTLYRRIYWTIFLGSEWRYASDLTQEEIKKLTRDDLAVLAHSESEKARRIAAQNGATPPASLSILARDRDQNVYRAAGHNPSTPAEAIAEMRRLGRADDVSPNRLQFLWSELATYERIEGRVALDVARGYHGDELRVALARRGYDDGGALTELAGSYSLPSEAALILVDHSSESVRAALAKNTASAVSGDMLERLSRDRSIEVREAVIQNPNLPDSGVNRLLEDRRLRSAVIASGHLSVKVLIALEKDNATRRDVIDRLDNNPMGWGRSKNASPPDDFVDLLRRWAHSPNQQTRIAVSRNAATPLELLEELARDESLAGYVAGGFRTVVANNFWSDGYQLGKIGWYARYLSESDLAFLASSSSPTLRAARAGRYGGDPKVMDELARDPEPAVREAVARSEWVGFSQLQALADDDDEGVQRAATQSIRDLLRMDEAPYQAWSGDWLREQTNFAAYFPTTHDGHIDMSLMRRIFIPGQPTWMLTNENLELLARSKSAGVRAAVAAFSGSNEDRGMFRSELSADTLLVLLLDPDEAVRRAAYTNVGRSAVAVAGRSDISPDALVEYARSSSDAVRAAVAANGATPGPLLANLARDRSVGVRSAVAVNPSTPSPALAALSRDDDEDVLMELLVNPKAPIAFLEEQAERRGGYSEWERHRRIAANPASPAGVLRKLAYSKRVDIRKLIAQHPSVPEDTLEVLSFDEDASVREVASRPNGSGKNPTGE